MDITPFSYCEPIKIEFDSRQNIGKNIMKKYSLQDATQLVETYLQTAKSEIGLALVILSDETIRGESGWLFFYNSVEFINTGDVEFALAGNGPIRVLETGELTQLSSATSIEEAVKSLGSSS
jgi:Immunity protein 35